MNTILENGTNFLWANARLLERTVFDYRFRNGSPTHILNILQAYQNDDGGWPIRWEPPGEMARQEWRGYKTVMALTTLRAYGKI